VVTGQGAEPLRETALRLPYTERTLCAVTDAVRLDESHPARHGGVSGHSSGAEPARALVCAGMRCSLPVTEPKALREQVREMLEVAP
jgi:uncharacterized protein YyaL (SSP411 family)